MAGRGIQYARECLLRAAQQGVLQKQVAAGAGSQTQLREYKQGGAVFGSFRSHGFHAGGVISAVRYADARSRCRDLQKSVFHGNQTSKKFKTYVYYIPICAGMQPECKQGKRTKFKNFCCAKSIYISRGNFGILRIRSGGG